MIGFYYFSLFFLVSMVFFYCTGFVGLCFLFFSRVFYDWISSNYYFSCFFLVSMVFFYCTGFIVFIFF